MHATSETHEAAREAAEAAWRELRAESAPDAPDADTAGIVREGFRMLDRMAAQAEARRAADARVRAAAAAMPDAIEHGRDDLDAAAAILRAADAVPDPRREAERRVVEAARAWHASMPAVLRLAADRIDGPMRPLLDALAALEGGEP